MGTNTVLYEQDFYTWCLTTATLIREKKWHEIDPEALAEEVERLGQQDKEDLEQHLQDVLTHLLTWWAKPEERCGRWKSTIRQARRQVAWIVRDSPSLQTHLAAMLMEEYPSAREKALEDTQLSTLPETCPFTLAQVLEEDFWPEGTTLVPQDTPQ
jgi:hypothetical protein